MEKTIAHRTIKLVKVPPMTTATCFLTPMARSSATNVAIVPEMPANNELLLAVRVVGVIPVVVVAPSTAVGEEKSSPSLGPVTAAVGNSPSSVFGDGGAVVHTPIAVGLAGGLVR